MAENLTIARPYAEAVFALACEHDALDKWQDMLGLMAEACKNEYFITKLKTAANTQIAADNLILLLKDLLDENGMNFVRVIAENNRFEVLPEIYSEFVKMRQKHDKVLTVQFVSAREIKDDETEVLKQKLADKYGCKIILNKSVDPSIIGGVVLKIGDEVIDASFKNSLNALSTALKS
ncbi:MAG: F0F1 ATP synthase subunit delta [Succinivibrio sp.]|nr:F0F1 ATP synthase subunit delta [Succinivibrio sp.]